MTIEQVIRKAIEENKIEKIHWWSKDRYTKAKYKIEISAGIKFCTKDGCITTKSGGFGFLYEDDCSKSEAIQRLERLKGKKI